MRGLLIGRAAKLEQLGLACREGPAGWTIDPGAERALRDLSVRNDIIKTMHRAMTRDGGRFDPSALALHSKTPSDPIVGRLVERGLQDELAGSAYAIVDGTDGRMHRSEEHTSELQSLMRISYAVFCLKKQKQTSQTK